MLIRAHGDGVALVEAACAGLERPTREWLAALRQRGDAAAALDAVIDPAARRAVYVARDARDPDAREALRRAALRVDRARAARPTPDAPLALWRALVDGRWSLVERFESDGRRYLVARRNDPTRRAACALTERERRVVALAVLGHPLKVAAYELGLSESTVSKALCNAMARLGVRTRAALIELHGALVAAAPEDATASASAPAVTAAS